MPAQSPTPAQSPAQTPTNQEQLLLELINRLRLDPGGEAGRLIPDLQDGAAVQANITQAMRYFGVDPAAFAAQMAALDAAPALAWNNALALAAEDHTLRLIAADEQSHQVAGEASLWARIGTAGYANRTRVSENVYSYAQDGLYAHAGFVIDWGYDAEDSSGGTLLSNWRSLGDGMQDPAGHRVNMMNPALTEVGIAMIAESDAATSVGPFLVTQDFGTRWDYQAQMLGVVLADADGDRFYDIGEGLGGITVTAQGSAGVYTTTTWSSGGYQMVLPQGSYTVTFAGAGLAAPLVYSATMGAANLKLDGFSQDIGSDLWLEGGAGPNLLNAYGGDDMLFGDGFRAAYAPEMAAQVYRLYRATLDRAPDAAGLTDWTGRLVTESRSLQGVAQGFVDSAEFRAVYGALDDAGFVTLLYRNVLDRAPDAGGLANWVARLEEGASRAQVVLGLSESAEFRNATRAEASRFVLARDEAGWADDVFRLYQATLDRDPDAAGLRGWTTALANGRDYAGVVAGFVDSAEFRARFGGLDDAGFVTLLYRNVLDRAPDAAGMAGWLAELAGGASRATVVAGFAQSGEFIAATGAALAGWMGAQGVQDVLTPGGGDNDLWGGLMADEFRFAASADGTSRIHDFESWDLLRFTGFGYDAADDIRARMVQSGADVVFSDQGVTVTLLGTTLAEIGDANLLF